MTTLRKLPTSRPTRAVAPTNTYLAPKRIASNQGHGERGEVRPAAGVAPAPATPARGRPSDHRPQLEDWQVHRYYEPADEDPENRHDQPAP